MGLILLVLLSSFSVTVCTAKDYHHVEFQAMIIINQLQICAWELFRMTKNDGKPGLILLVLLSSFTVTVCTVRLSLCGDSSFDFDSIKCLLLYLSS